MPGKFTSRQACDNLWQREDLLTTELKPATRTSALPRIAWAVLIVITLYLCYFSHLDVIGFVGPDEPRYAWIARDMAESGDWITPRLYGRPWFEKPPLLYWGGAFFFKLAGEGRPEIAARLPSAISALLATLALAWLAWRTYGEQYARWLLLLLPTSVGMIGFSHACATDMPFAGMLTIAMVSAAVILGLFPSTEDTPVLPRTPWLTLILFGFFEGLAVLAKGPVALILTSGAAFFWAFFTKRWRDAFRLLHPAAIVAFCLTALPWYILCARRNSDFFRIFIIEHNFKRYLTPEFQHTQPFWFYLPIALIALLPWAPGVVAAAISTSRGPALIAKNRSLFVFSLCWFAFPVLFFSLSQSKLPGYILPAVPAGIFASTHLLWSKEFGVPLGWRTYSIVTGLTLTLSAVLFVILDFEDKIPGGQDVIPAPWHSSIYLPLFFGGVISFVLAWKKRLTPSAVSSTVTAVLALLGLYSGLHWLDPIYSARYSAKAAAHIYPDFQASSAAVHREQRGIEYGLNYYLRRELPVWSAGDPSAKWVFTPYRGTEQVEKAGFKCPLYIVFPTAFPCERAELLRGAGSGRQPQ